MAMPAKNEKTGELTNKQKNQPITTVIHSSRVLLDLALCLPSIMPCVLMHLDLFFIFIRGESGAQRGMVDTCLVW